MGLMFYLPVQYWISGQWHETEPKVGVFCDVLLVLTLFYCSVINLVWLVKLAVFFYRRRVLGDTLNTFPEEKRLTVIKNSPPPVLKLSEALKMVFTTYDLPLFLNLFVLLFLPFTPPFGALIWPICCLLVLTSRGVRRVYLYLTRKQPVWTELFSYKPKGKLPAECREFTTVDEKIVRPLFVVRDIKNEQKARSMPMSLLPALGSPIDGAVYRKPKRVLYEVSTIEKNLDRSHVVFRQYFIADLELINELMSPLISGPGFTHEEVIKRARLKLSGGIKHLKDHRENTYRTGASIWNDSMIIFEMMIPHLRTFVGQTLNE